MKWGVELAVGNKRSIAAIAKPDSEPVILERESVLHHAPDGTVQLGETALGSTGLRGFLDRVGTDDTDNFSEHMTRGEELVATAMYCLVKEVRTLTDQNLNISAVIPAGWSNDSVDALRGALDSMDLDGVELIPEEKAPRPGSRIRMPTTVQPAEPQRWPRLTRSPLPVPNPSQPILPSQRTPSRSFRRSS
ncbi:hypothetical protein [Rhodococcus erythropolis]|uniref:hypothetical protein n=1 Tax=Rhodococcus erythropolis TaxID=1833 RepID=UPI00038E5DF8|nr:hypothetical protein [Rhodococcus erythropolis]EQM31351.1 hypothetical protein N601_22315 [Rhodococcus erythropolis DN1]